MPNSKKTNKTTKTTKTTKTNNMKFNSMMIKTWIGEIIEISLLLVAFGIIIEILFGSVAPLGSGILINLIEILRTMGENGLVGLAALGIVVYLLKRSKVFA